MAQVSGKLRAEECEEPLCIEKEKGQILFPKLKLLSQFHYTKIISSPFLLSGDVLCLFLPTVFAFAL